MAVMLVPPTRAIGEPVLVSLRRMLVPWQNVYPGSGAENVLIHFTPATCLKCSTAGMEWKLFFLVSSVNIRDILPTVISPVPIR